MMPKKKNGSSSKKIRPKLSKPAKEYISDFVDINWVINHVKDLKARLSVLEQLGYRIGKDPYIDENTTYVKSAKVGKRGEIRIQVSRKLKHCSFVYCAILT
jgi:hypothetical protein